MEKNKEENVLKHIDEKEKNQIKGAFDRGVEMARYKNKIPRMLEEERIRKENKQIAKECGIEWI